MFRAACLLGLLPVVASAQLTSPLPIHNAGTLKSGVAIGHVFELQNAGDRPLEILNVRSGCGCVRAVPDRMTFAAGEKGVLRLDVQTATQPTGPNVWGAEVTYRTAGREAVLNLRVTGQLQADVQIRPAALIIHTAATVKHPFVLTERRPKAMTLRSTTTTSQHIEARASEPVNHGGAWVRSVQLNVLPTCPEGRHECSLVLVTDDPQCPEMRVPFTVIKKASDAVQVSPALVEWETTGTEPLPARLAVLKGPEDRPVVIEEIAFTHRGIVATWVSGPRATVRFVIDREQIPAEGFEGFAEVRLSSPSAHKVRIPLSVRVR